MPRKRRTPAQRRAAKNSNLKRRYGITIDDYDRLLAAQRGGCYIFGMRPARRALHVDHNHAQEVDGKATRASIRGLLCVRCNRFLAQIGDEPVLAQRAVDYLLWPPAETILNP